MEKQIIINSGRCGARIGGTQVFTKDGAIQAYKTFAARCYANLTMESSVALTDESFKMHDIGFTWKEIKTLEISAIQALAVSAEPTSELTEKSEAVGYIHYVHSGETIAYQDGKRLIKDYAEGIDIYGPNGINATVHNSDIELGYQIFSIEAGAYGYSVDREKYIRIAQQYGCMAPQRMDAIEEDNVPYHPYIESTEKQLIKLADMMEIGSRATDDPPVGKIILHTIKREIVYTSKEQLKGDYVAAVKKFGAAGISATLYAKDHELSFALDKIEAENLGFKLDKDKYMELIEKYGQNSSVLTQAAYDLGPNDIEVTQEPTSFELEM